ncbi:RidA family protein [Streptococcus uberis]|uniref:RidA family protein n=1 Tax=Streptococcus uberis TaxID=1349 RepID=UPI00193A65E8|nr:RidA family protein [Streptococcus uberis]
MKSIRRYDVNEESANTGLVEAGDFYFLNYCTGNVGQPIEDQINGAFDEMERRLGLVGLTLEAVVKMDCLFRDVWNLPVMEKIIKERFNGKYPARKTIQTEFAHQGGAEGLLFQVDGIAYSKPINTTLK